MRVAHDGTDVIPSIVNNELTTFLHYDWLHFLRRVINNGNRTEWSPIQSVIILVITKSDDRAAGVRFVYHEYDYRLNWTTRSPIIN